MTTIIYIYVYILSSSFTSSNIDKLNRDNKLLYYIVHVYVATNVLWNYISWSLQNVICSKYTSWEHKNNT